MTRVKHAVITGGSSGIGRAIAERLARQDYTLSLIARDASRLDATAQTLAERTGLPVARINTFPCDVSDRTAVDSAMSAVIAAAGAPDLAILSAGMARPGRLSEVPPAVFEETMAVNYFGALWSVRALVPAMREAGRGRIVLIASGAGLVGFYGYTPYAPTKFALRGLAECLRNELRPDGIAVSIVYPPDTETPQLAAENATKPPETKAITGSAGVWSADGVAELTLRRIAQGRFAVTPGLTMTLLHRFAGLLAPVLHRQFDAVVARMRRVSTGAAR